MNFNEIIEYKGWKIWLESKNMDYMGTFYKLCATYERGRLIHKLKEFIPYFGRMTEVQECNVNIEVIDTSIKKALSKIKKEINKYGELKRILISDES